MKSREEPLQQSVSLHTLSKGRSGINRVEDVAIAIIIATKGRHEILEETLQSVRRQTWPATHVFVIVTCPEDAPAKNAWNGINVLVGPTGGSAQHHNANRCEPLLLQYIAFFFNPITLQHTF